MAIYQVKRTLIVHATVNVIVEADSPEEADSAAFDALPSNIGNSYPGSGWRATVEVKPPSGVSVASGKLRATWIDHTDAANGVKPRRVTDAA